MPDMAVVVEGGALDEAAEAAVVEFFRTGFKGLDNAHRTLFLPITAPDVKVRFEKLNTEIKELGFDRLMQACRDRIISAHRVPPRLVGVAQPGALGGTSEVFGQLSIFQDLIVTPRQNYFVARLGQVLRDMGYPQAKLKFNAMDTTAQETDSDYYTKMVAGGILTVDEAREDLGYPAMKGHEGEAVKAHLSLVRSLQKLRETG
jgi:capsid portal protein